MGLEVDPKYQSAFTTSRQVLVPDESPDTLVRQLLNQPLDFPNSHCPSQVLPNLFLGGFDAAREDVLKQKNICAVINLAASNTETIEKNGITYMRINADDSTDFYLQPYFRSTFDFIELYLNQGKSVLIHCMAGVSRSATIMLAYLLQKHPTLTLDEADYLVYRRRPFTNPNTGFLTELQTFEKSRS